MAIDPTIQRVASAMMPTSGVAPTFNLSGGAPTGQPQMPDGSAGGAPSFHLTPNMASPPPTQLGAPQGNFQMPTVQTGAPTHTPMPLSTPTNANSGLEYLSPTGIGTGMFNPTSGPNGSYSVGGDVFDQKGNWLGASTNAPLGQAVSAPVSVNDYFAPDQRQNAGNSFFGQLFTNPR